MKNIISIAIDGPVGAGKSTISREVARRLGFTYVDTGALYRAIGVYCDSCGIDVHDDNAVSQFLKKEQIQIEDLDYSDVIRTPKASLLASRVSANPDIRALLLELQRDYARKESVVMDGRDIGTVVLPDATLKIFLTAAAEERAGRRYDELVKKADGDCSIRFEDVLVDLNKRDYDDSHREHAPLKQADDAVLVDTTGNSFEESVEQILQVIKETLGALPQTP